VARYGRPRIARDVGADPVFFDDPELPDTHSEAALPLKVGDRSIGVLDVQSVDVHALGPEDIDVLSVLANQVGIAVENSRMFGRTRRALDSLSEVSSREIDSMARERGALGYTYSPDGKVTQAVELDEATSRSALGSGRTFMPDPSSQAIAPNMAIPVKLRDQVIGLITVQASDKSREWSENELALVRTISERAAAALENATLLAESQRRAAKERAIGEISARIGASTRFDSILQTAARELSRALGGSDVLVQIEPVAMDHATKAEGS
jgi:GAF domain-containing protein